MKPVGWRVVFFHIAFVLLNLVAWADTAPMLDVQTLNAAASSSNSVLAQAQGFKLSGTVHYQKQGDIYISVVTAEQWKKDLQTPYQLLLPMDASAAKNGSLAFEFKGVPQGAYCIKAYQDVNRNGKLDFVLGPAEPVGMYRNARPVLRPPRFDEMEFKLDKDLTGVKLELK